MLLSGIALVGSSCGSSSPASAISGPSSVVAPSVLAAAVRQASATARGTTDILAQVDVSGHAQVMSGSFDAAHGTALIRESAPSKMAAVGTSVVVSPGGIFASLGPSGGGAGARWVELPIPPPTTASLKPAVASGATSTSPTPSAPSSASAPRSAKGALAQYEIVLFDPIVLIDTALTAVPPVVQAGTERVGALETTVYRYHANLARLASLRGVDAPVLKLAAALFGGTGFSGEVWIGRGHEIVRLEATVTAPASGPLAGMLHGVARFTMTATHWGSGSPVVLPPAASVVPLGSSSPGSSSTSGPAPGASGVP